jgi:hypothetical protein
MVIPEMIINCNSCHHKLTDFIAYLPEKGEVCMDCYKEYAIREDKKELNMHKKSLNTNKPH